MPVPERTAVVTGATSGIGRATALALAERGFRLFLIGRNRERGDRVLHQCRRRTGAGAEFLLADLAALDEIRAAAAAIASACRRIDVLVNNAGARNDDYRESPEGIERTFAANHLGHFLFTHLLKPALEQAHPGRVITVASSVHSGADLADGWISPRATYNRHVAYANSKLANVVFARELARCTNSTLLVSNAVDPGMVVTRFGRNNGLARWLKHLVVHGMRGELVSAVAGADTLVYLATSDEIGSLTGRYWCRRREMNPSPLARDPEVARELWDLSSRLVGFEG